MFVTQHFFSAEDAKMFFKDTETAVIHSQLQNKQLLLGKKTQHNLLNSKGKTLLGRTEVLLLEFDQCNYHKVVEHL